MDILTTAHSNDDATEPSQSYNEIHVQPNLAIKRLVDIGLSKLEEHRSIIVVAKGNTINKAITGIEIIKRRHNDTLHQYNQLGKMMASADQWNFVDDRIDAVSAVLIHLSFTPMPELGSTTTYQPPSSST